MAHQTCPPVLEPFLGKDAHQRGQFGMDRLFDQLAGSVAQDVSERVGCKTRWIGQLCDGGLWHVAYPFLSRELTAIRHRHDLPPLRASPTFARFSWASRAVHCLAVAACRNERRYSVQFRALYCLGVQPLISASYHAEFTR